MSALIESYGVTTEGKPVVRGIFRFFETTGLPLSMCLDECWTRGLVPGWLELEKEMQGPGVKAPRVKIAAAVRDSFLPKEVKDRVLAWCAEGSEA